MASGFYYHTMTSYEHHGVSDQQKLDRLFNSCPGWYQRKHQSPVLLLFLCEQIQQRQVHSYHIGSHDDVINWKHFRCYWPFVRGIHRSPVNSPHKGQWCGALMFSLICIWINGWVNNREAGDLRRYHAHYEVAEMSNAESAFHHMMSSGWLKHSIMNIHICFNMTVSSTSSGVVIT